MRDLILILVWMYGIILSKGSSLMMLAIFFPPYAWYVTVEHFVIKFGVL